MNDAPISLAHIGLLLTMAVAIMIDIMKPTALAFVIPGMTQEYKLKSPLNPGGTPREDLFSIALCRRPTWRCPASAVP